MHRAGDVVGLEGAAGRVVEERRVDHARLDQRDLDVGLGHLLAQRLAHRRDRPLGGRVERARAARAGRPPSSSAACGRCSARGSGRARRGWTARRRRRWCRPSTASAPRVSSRKPRLAPKPALAKNTSMRPKRSSAVATSACWSSQLVTSQRTGDRAPSPSSSASAASLSSERAASTTPVPELDGPAGGGGADAAAGAGDDHHGLRRPWPGFLAAAVGRLGRTVAGVNPTEARFPGVRAVRRALRELLPQGLPSGGAARRVDPLHGPQARRRGAQGIGLVHPLRGRAPAGRSRPRNAARPGARASATGSGWARRPGIGRRPGVRLGRARPGGS